MPTLTCRESGPVDVSPCSFPLLWKDARCSLSNISLYDAQIRLYDAQRSLF